MGAPQKWMVYSGKSHLKWMMTGGTPISGNLHMPESTNPAVSEVPGIPNWFVIVSEQSYLTTGSC